MHVKSFLTRMAVMIATIAMISVFGAAVSAPLRIHAQDTVSLPATSDQFATVYTRISPSVVAVAVEKDAVVSQAIPGMNVPQEQQPQRGLGSGFVLSTEGYILTNDHVVDGATRIEVDFNDGTLARAHVVGTDPDADLAVIQVENVDAAKLIPVNFANSDDLFIGQTVLAIGSPFGERWTLTSGIVSGKERLIQGLGGYSIGGVIQTDAAINPGNSGGPLLNLNGEVVGVNSQIATTAGSSSGVGFAIPSNLAQRVADDLIDKGFVEYSYMGISGGDVTLDAIEALKMSNDTRGVLVTDVAAGGPADRAKLQSAVFDSSDTHAKLTSADIITAINDHKLLGMADLISYLASDTKPGDKVTLTVTRNGTDEMKIDVTLIPRPHASQS